MKLSRALGWSATNVAASLVVKLGSLVVLSRLLTPADFGVYNIGMAVVLMGALIAQLGVPTNLVSQKEINAGLASTGLWLATTSSLIMALAGSGIILIVWSSDTLGQPHIIALFGTMLICQVAINVLEAVARRDLRMKLLMVGELAAGLGGNLLVSVALALMGVGVEALVIGQLVYAVVKIAILGWAVWPGISAWPEFKSVPHVADGSLAIVVAEVANMATVQIQRPIVGYSLGVDAAGIWSRAYQVIVLQLSIIVQPMDNLILPVLSRHRHEGRDFTGMLATGIGAMALITLPAAALTALWAPLMVPFLFGPQWTALIVPLQILAPLLFFRGLERIMLSTSRAAGTMGPRAIIQVVQLALILVALGLTLRYGLVAASWGYLAATAVGFCITVWRSHVTTGLGAIRLAKSIGPGALSGGLGMSMAWVLEPLLPDRHATLALLAASACMGALVVSLALIYRARIARSANA